MRLFYGKCVFSGTGHSGVFTTKKPENLTPAFELVSATVLIPHLLSDSELLSLKLHRDKTFTPLFLISHILLFFTSFFCDFNHKIKSVKFRLKGFVKKFFFSGTGHSGVFTTKKPENLTPAFELVSATVLIPHLLSDSELLSLKLHRDKTFTPLFLISHILLFFTRFFVILITKKTKTIFLSSRLNGEFP